MQYWTTKACSVIAKTHPEALSHYRAIPQSKGQAGRVTKCNYMYGATGQLFVNKLYIQLHVYIRRLSLTHQLGLASFLSTTANLKLNLSCPSAHFPTNIKRHVCHIRWPFFLALIIVPYPCCLFAVFKILLWLLPDLLCRLNCHVEKERAVGSLDFARLSTAVNSHQGKQFMPTTTRTCKYP